VFYTLFAARFSWCGAVRLLAYEESLIKLIFYAQVCKGAAAVRLVLMLIVINRPRVMGAT